MLPSHSSVSDLGALVVAMVVGLLVLFFLFDFGRKKGSVIPGIPPSDPAKGNLDDISKAGSLHQFLTKLHKDYGELASFWMGDVQVLSFASPRLWKDMQGLFDRPVHLFKMFEPLLTKHSIQFANGPEGQKRHKLVTSSFGHLVMSRYYDIFTKVAQDKVKEWEGLGPEDQILLNDASFDMSSQAIMLSAIGPIFHGKKEAVQLVDSYNACYVEMERRLLEGVPEEGSEYDIKFKEGRKKLERLLKQCIDERRKSKPEEDEKNVLDRMIEEGYPEEVVSADILAILVAGLHTSALCTRSKFLTSLCAVQPLHPMLQDAVTLICRSESSGYPRRLRCSLLLVLRCKTQTFGLNHKGLTPNATTPKE